MSLLRCVAAAGLALALACGGGPVAPTEGLELVFGVEEGGADLDAITATLDKRLDALGVRAREVRPAPPDQVIVRVGPGMASEELTPTLLRPGRLEFRFAEPNPPDPPPPGALVLVDPYGDDPLVVVQQPVITGANVVSAKMGTSEWGAHVWLTFDEAGATAFTDATAAHVGDKLVILLDGELVSAPVVRERIAGGKAQVSVGQTGSPADQEAEAKRLAAVLGGDALPAPLALLEVRAFGD